MDTLPSDIIYTILSEFIIVPHICKSVYNICQLPNSVYLRKRKTHMIMLFLEKIEEDSHNYPVCNKLSNMDAIIDYHPMLFWNNNLLKKLSHQQLLKLITVYPYITEYMDQSLITKDMVDILLQIPSNLEYIPEKYITYDRCYNAVSKNGNAIAYVPEEFKDEKMITTALEDSGYALGYIDNSLWTTDMIKLALDEDPNLIKSLNKQFLTDEIYLYAIEHGFDNIKYIPEHLKTDEVYKTILYRGGYTQKFDTIPQHLINRQILIDLTYKYPEYILLLPYEYITYELCLHAINHNVYCIDVIPDDYKTIELCRIAVTKYPYAIAYVSEKYIDEDLCILALSHCGQALEYITEKLEIGITYRMCETAVCQSGYALKHVPCHMRTKELCKIAILNDIDAFKFIPERLKTSDFFEEVYRYLPAAATFMGDDYINRFITEYNL